MNFASRLGIGPFKQRESQRISKNPRQELGKKEKSKNSRNQDLLKESQRILNKSKQVVITMISGLQANHFTSLIHSNVILL